MKKDIHPKEYRFVVFKDISNETTFLTRSTVNTKDTIVWDDGKEYPLFKLEISNNNWLFCKWNRFAIRRYIDGCFY